MAENKWLSNGGIKRISNEEINEERRWKTLFPKMHEWVSWLNSYPILQNHYIYYYKFNRVHLGEKQNHLFSSL